MREFIDYDKFEKTSRQKNINSSFGGRPIFTPRTDIIRIGQHHKSEVKAKDARYHSVEKVREWLTVENDYRDAEKWIDYIEELHASVKENGAYLNCPVRVYDKNGYLLVKDGDHRVGACIANGVRVPCVIVNKTGKEFARYVDYKTAMPVSADYTAWRGGNSDRFSIMELIDWRGKNVLDLGCNAGDICRKVKSLGANRIYGIDYDAACISKAAQAGICYICHDMSQGFSIDDDIDIVIMFSIVNWVRSDAFYNSVRKLAEKGSVVLFEAHHEDLRKPLYDKIKEVFDDISLLGHVNWSKGSKERKRAVYLMRKQL
jgi:2-polyprenyl-3-methyl-5-hydroxy-6-metoxy-1,4-benzoquinol methylase